MFPTLQIGPLALQMPGLLLLLGIWLATVLIERAAPVHKVPANVVVNMVFYALIGGIVGARLGYVLRFLNLYLDQPLSILALNPNTLSPAEGAVSMLVVAIIYGQRKGLPALRTLDALTPGAAVVALAIGFAHLSSGDAFGAVSSLPWAWQLWGAQRHPSQVYEIVAAGLILIAVLRLQREKTFPGFLALFFLGASALARLFLEAFRGDSALLFNSLRSAQVISWLVLAGSLLGLHLLSRSRRRT